MKESSDSQAMSGVDRELHAPRKPSTYHENFSDSLKDLKNLRIQLYSAADRFESSYNKTDHNQFVAQLSKDYVTKALVSTVDHLGSMADKLNKLMIERANEFRSAYVRFALIEQKLSEFQEFIGLNAISQHSLAMENIGYQARYILPGKTSRNVSEKHEDESISEDYRAARKKPSLGKRQSRMKTTIHPREQSPNPPVFSFTKVVPNKEAGKMGKGPISPFRFPLNRQSSDAKRSVTPSPISKPRWPPEPRRAVSECRRQRESRNRDKNEEIEARATFSTSKQLFKALIAAPGKKFRTNAIYIVK